MKTFPLKHCIPTSLLTRESYSDLICHLVSEGNANMIPHLSYDLIRCWNYIGLAMYGDIQVFNLPHSFMKINEWMNFQGIGEGDYPNILTKEWLEEYLK